MRHVFLLFQKFLLFVILWKYVNFGTEINGKFIYINSK